MAKFRVLWVPPHQRQLLCGVTYDEKEIVAAGHDPQHMVRQGEAELIPEPKKGK